MPSTSFWSLQSEQRFILEIIDCFGPTIALDGPAHHWAMACRKRHGTPQHFLRSYIKTLSIRAVSFDGWSAMTNMERAKMEEFCENKIAQINAGKYLGLGQNWLSGPSGSGVTGVVNTRLINNEV